MRLLGSWPLTFCHQKTISIDNNHWLQLNSCDAFTRIGGINRIPLLSNQFIAEPKIEGILYWDPWISCWQELSNHRDRWLTPLSLLQASQHLAPIWSAIPRYFSSDLKLQSPLPLDSNANIIQHQLCPFPCGCVCERADALVTVYPLNAGYQHMWVTLFLISSVSRQRMCPFISDWVSATLSHPQRFPLNLRQCSLMPSSFQLSPSLFPTLAYPLCIFVFGQQFSICSTVVNVTTINAEHTKHIFTNWINFNHFLCILLIFVHTHTHTHRLWVSSQLEFTESCLQLWQRSRRSYYALELPANLSITDTHKHTHSRALTQWLRWGT